MSLNFTEGVGRKNNYQSLLAVSRETSCLAVDGTHKAVSKKHKAYHEKGVCLCEVPVQSLP